MQIERMEHLGTSLLFSLTKTKENVLKRDSHVSLINFSKYYPTGTFPYEDSETRFEEPDDLIQYLVGKYKEEIRQQIKKKYEGYFDISIEETINEKDGSQLFQLVVAEENFEKKKLICGGLEDALEQAQNIAYVLADDAFLEDLQIEDLQSLLSNNNHVSLQRLTLIDTYDEHPFLVINRPKIDANYETYTIGYVLYENEKGGNPSVEIKKELSSFNEAVKNGYYKLSIQNEYSNSDILVIENVASPLDAMKQLEKHFGEIYHNEIRKVIFKLFK